MGKIHRNVSIRRMKETPASGESTVEYRQNRLQPDICLVVLSPLLNKYYNW